MTNILFKLAFLISFSLISPLFSEEKLETKTTQREFQFENEQVKVWKTTIAPHQPLQMHRHDNPRIIVGLKGGELTKIEELGSLSTLLFETGKAYWMHADPVNTYHADINETNEHIEVMVIELKKHP